MKDVDVRESVKVVTDNRFIVANGLEKLKLKERKLLYLAISQVRKTDKEFYEYRISPLEFADLMGIEPTHVYQEARAICKRLRPLGISCDIGQGKKKETIEYSLFSFIRYSNDSDIVFKLNPDMTEFLIGLNKNFTQPLLNDFMRMNSPYSMAIWHLFQREMKSKKPGRNKKDAIVFEVSLDELRQVTGATDKLKQMVHFKEKVLDKAIREIRDNCSINIEYENIRTGRTVTGFRFTATQCIGYDTSKMNPEEVDRIRRKAEELRNK